MATASKENGTKAANDFVTEHYDQKAPETQRFGEVTKDLPHPLDAKVRGDMVKLLNQLLANSIAIRDMYKKHHWQVAGPTFYPVHLLFDKHFTEQVEIVDEIAERVQLLGGVAIAMGGDVAKMTQIEAPPEGAEELPVQISRLLAAHKQIIRNCLDIAEKADDAGDQGTNDLVVSDVLRPNELQAWFIGKHLVAMPLVNAE